MGIRHAVFSKGAIISLNMYSYTYTYTYIYIYIKEVQAKISCFCREIAFMGWLRLVGSLKLGSLKL